MQDQEQVQEQVYDDGPIVAAFTLPELEKKYNLKITPFTQLNNRVAWRVSGDVSGALKEIFENKKVGINDYLKALRAVRHCIFTLKKIKQ